MFNNLWEFTLKITHLFGKDLGFEFEFAQIGYFVFSTALLGGLYITLEKANIMTMLAKLPFVGIFFTDVAFYLGYPPIGLAVYLNKLKLDGKAPYKYVFDYIEFLFEPGMYQNWEAVSTENIHIKVNVEYRKTRKVDVFVETDKKEKIKFRHDYE